MKQCVQLDFLPPSFGVVLSFPRELQEVLKPCESSHQLVEISH